MIFEKLLWRLLTPKTPVILTTGNSPKIVNYVERLGRNYKNRKNQPGLLKK